MFCFGQVFWSVMSLVFIASKVNPMLDLTEDHTYYKLDTENNPTYFELYTRDHMTVPITILANSHSELLKLDRVFKHNVETKIVTHGWQASSRSESVMTIKNAYLRKRPCNVIAVNWENLAEYDYIPAANNTKVVGKFMSELIYYLHNKLAASWTSIHIIGHSLGAQAAGYAGYFTKGKVGRITGLDPAMLLFSPANTDSRLDHTDAQFVDVIHTSAGILGVMETVGTVDFYPDGGIFYQPGCFGNTFVMGTCSSFRSYKYFAESIETSIGFYGHKCSTVMDAVAGKCNALPSVLMGDHVPKTAIGIFYLKANAKSPFAKGNV